MPPKVTVRWSLDNLGITHKRSANCLQCKIDLDALPNCKHFCSYVCFRNFRRAHPQVSPKVTGGRYRIYKIWDGMRDRCLRARPGTIGHKDYRARGITICKAWLDFHTFEAWALASGYHDDLSIERKDNNGNYEPNNCRWATSKEQMNNKRNTRYVTAFGETKTVGNWDGDPRCVVSTKNLAQRIFKCGWPAEKALTTPLMHRDYKMRNKIHPA